MFAGWWVSSCSGDSDGADEKVFLEVRVSSEIGKIARKITFRDGRREITSMVLENTIKTQGPREAGIVGDFSEVYEAVTGKEASNPSELQSVAKIFEAAKEAGWSWEIDKNSPTDSDLSERTVYRMWR
jgi:hypothetical protein